jgi:hypothetical protein
MVIFRESDGTPGYHQLEALDDAVRFVEELRNERQVSETRVFAMHEIPIEVKSVWKVEVMPPDASMPPIAPPAVVPPLVSVAVVPEAVPEFESSPFATADEPSQSHSRFGLFGRS